MSSFRKAILVIVAATVGLIGIVALPTPASASSVGTIEFTGSLDTPPLGPFLLSWPNGGGITFRSDTCVDSAATTEVVVPAAGLCYIEASGNYGASPIAGGGYCGFSSGSMSGYFRLSNGLVYSFGMSYDLVAGAFKASGTAYSPWGGAGTFVLNGTVTDGEPGFGHPVHCLDNPTRFVITATAQFETVGTSVGAGDADGHLLAVAGGNANSGQVALAGGDANGQISVAGDDANGRAVAVGGGDATAYGGVAAVSLTGEARGAAINQGFGRYTCFTTGHC